MSITAAVDGSALGNPGPAGWAWVVSEDAWAAGGFDRATNNVGELTALLRLLQDTAAAGFADQTLNVLADSQYVINSVTKWMPSWKRKGWKKADGKPVANQELMEQLDRALAGREVRFEWVKGHAGHDLNEAADLRARAAAEAHKSGRKVPRGPGFSGTIGSWTATPSAMRGEWARSSAQRGESGSWRSSPSGTEPGGAKARSGAGGAGGIGGAGGAGSGAGETRANRGSTGQTGAREKSLGEPIAFISATEAPERWQAVLDSARVEPVTITETGKPPLLLMDADLAYRALALLDEDEAAEGTLF